MLRNRFFFALVNCRNGKKTAAAPRLTGFVRTELTYFFHLTHAPRNVSD